MKTAQLQQKLLLALSKAKKNEGFTLIELLVVIIIIGVLSAVALPNLLGQVGGARETEATNAIGAVNRGQQSFFTETSDFYESDASEDAIDDLREDITDNLGTGISLEFYDRGEIATDDDFDGDNAALFALGNTNRQNDNTRDHGGGVVYDPETRQFDTFICRQTQGSISGDDAFEAVGTGDLTADCSGTDQELVGGSAADNDGGQDEGE